MKRLIALVLLCCLLLCACGQFTTPTEPATESIPVTQAQTQPEAKKVTLYLLTKVTYFDSGSVEYHYDENHNIDSYTVFDIENTAIYQVFFEEKDANGMACVIRSQWPGESDNEIRNLTYFENGKLKQEQIAGSNYSSYQYEYDQTGNRTETREYYDGILQSVVFYTYDGELLTAAYCEDSTGNKVFECRVVDGLVMEKIFLGYDSEYGYRYEYDEKNNLIQTTVYMEGENLPGDQYVYAAVEVDADRARYLLEQQKYLIPIA